jgi:hypothetical protein
MARQPQGPTTGSPGKYGKRGENLGKPWNMGKNMLINHENGKNQANSGGKQRNFWAFMGFRQKWVMI